MPILWPLIGKMGGKINFAHTSFKWSNLASKNAGVTVVIVGLGNEAPKPKLYSVDSDGLTTVKNVSNINSYLVDGPNIDIQPSKKQISNLGYMDLGNMAKDGGYLLLSPEEAVEAIAQEPFIQKYILDFVGSQEYIRGVVRKCIWIDDDQVDDAKKSKFISERLAGVEAMRLESPAQSTEILQANHIALSKYRVRQKIFQL